MMVLSTEQLNILNTDQHIKINAVAGSGKTTTLIEYAKSRPAGSRILYLAFNKSVKLHAQQKFNDAGLNGVIIETAHSLAYKNIVQGSNYTLRKSVFKNHELIDILRLPATSNEQDLFALANHVNKYVAYFCNSDKEKLSELNYLGTIQKKTTKPFVESNLETISRNARKLLGKMDAGEIEITHDFYLKKFQLSKPELPFDYILFDEGQDASPAMLDIFLNQSCIKVIVGDTHQQIYGWRYAVNSLEKVNYPTFPLSTSFRFGNEIASLAKEAVSRKSILSAPSGILLNGQGSNQSHSSKAILARTNLGLLTKAIELVIEKKKVKSLYFEGNLSSYTYADEGASLYDVLNLFNRQRHLIRDKIIRSMKSVHDLEQYIIQTEDVQLATMLELVKKYNHRLPSIIKELKAYHVSDADRNKADLIFSTVHRAKGMEYDCVELADDFLTEPVLLKQLEESDFSTLVTEKLEQEINLLYVAVTRAKTRIHIPESLTGNDTRESEHVKIIRTTLSNTVPNGESASAVSTASSTIQAKQPDENNQAYSVASIRKKHKDAYRSWTTELDDELTIMYCEGYQISAMAKHFGRTEGAIRSRITKLELAELYG